MVSGLVTHFGHRPKGSLPIHPSDGGIGLRLAGLVFADLRLRNRGWRTEATAGHQLQHNRGNSEHGAGGIRPNSPGADLAGDDEVKRFKVEAEAAAQLDHPGIVPIFEIGEVAEQHYFSMGFVNGKSAGGRVTRWAAATTRSC